MAKAATPTITIAAGAISLTDSPAPISLSPTALATPTPQPSATPVHLSIPPTPTFTKAAGQASIPKAYIRILTPGPLSKVLSPINLEGSVIPGAGGLVRVELVGEDGEVISRQVLRFLTPAGQRIGINPQVDFEITGAAETARLQVSVDDPFGRIASLASVEVILLSMGDVEIYSNNNLLEPVVIREPTPNQIVTGNTLEVQGVARPSGNQPLSLELITDQGTVIGTRQATLGKVGPDGYAPFETELTYNLETPAWARLLVHEPSPRLPGDAAISSLKVYLNPENDQAPPSP
ncbi:MAG: hypothetical protein M1281_05085 [Chloroflexi bacterium]|nr:hypothetical protein [Chloroflexota bacterium]